jgi:prolyl oligopeptidase
MIANMQKRSLLALGSRAILVFIAGLAVSGSSNLLSQEPQQETSLSEKFEYPVSRTGDVTDNYHGTQVADPYRWLEDDVRESDDVRKWVTQQNELTFNYLQSLPYRNAINDRLTQLWDYEKYGAPFRRGERYFFFKNDGLQNQSVLYQQDSLDAPAKVLLDPNEWASDGTIALGSLSFSPNGQLLAYSVQEAGSDWQTWKVLEVATGEQRTDEIEWSKFGSVSWTADNQGIYYSAYDPPAAEGQFQELNLGQKVYYHQLGDAQADDKLVHQNADEPEWGFAPSVTEDGKYLIITVWQGTDDRYRVLFKSLEQPDKPFTVLVEKMENEYSFLGNNGSQFFFKSDLKAPRKRIIAIDVAGDDLTAWKEIVPEVEQAMESAGIVGDTLIIEYLQDAKTQVKLFDLKGTFVREVDFPGIGSARGFGGKRDHDETFYSFSSFNRPPATYRYDLATGESTQLQAAKVDFDAEDYEVNQVFYASKDGTRVPMFVAHKKRLKLDGSNPTLLYGYGGFNISLTPGFSVSRLQWMEMGGVFAMANLRGGGEYGKAWHKAGTKTKKQNVFDDFIAAAEYLIDQKYTSPNRLAIQGGSNGGLLVGACMAQRPDLFGACLPAVGVMDMLRFHKFTAGRFWVDDYGNAEENAEEFAAIYKYSPYHNLKKGTEYPATMVTTADTDDRVVPGHSFKFAAMLQAAQSGPDPTLIRIETKAGHGAGKPTAKVIEETADLWSFLVKNLDFQPEIPPTESTSN